MTCEEAFGSECLFCQDENGCGQCVEGFIRTYDAQEDLWYCAEATPNPTESPTEKPTGNPTVTSDPSDGPCPAVSDTINHCSEDPNCVNCASWGGCNQCAAGYWVFQYNFRCQPCSNIEGCNSCNPWVGCSSCDTGYSITWTEQCPVADGGVSTIATCV